MGREGGRGEGEGRDGLDCLPTTSCKSCIRSVYLARSDKWLERSKLG